MLGCRRGVVPLFPHTPRRLTVRAAGLVALAVPLRFLPFSSSPPPPQVISEIAAATMIAVCGLRRSYRIVLHAERGVRRRMYVMGDPPSSRHPLLPFPPPPLAVGAPCVVPRSVAASIRRWRNSFFFISLSFLFGSLLVGTPVF